MKSDQYRTSVLSVAEMYQADELALQHVKSSYCLMQHAASAVADFVQTLVFPGNSKPYVLLLCGKGNNGGDGLLAAQTLAQRGYQVKTIFCGEQSDTDALTGDAGRAFDAFTRAGLCIDIYTGKSAAGDREQWGQVFEQWGQVLIIDAIFGAGLTRSIQGSVASLIESINALRQTDEFTERVSILSIDLPSGINGDSGNSHLTENAKGTPHLCAIKADYTISFFRPKPAHFLYPGRAYCGELTIADIAIPNSVLEDIQPQIHENTPEYWQTLFPIRNDTTHKYQRGHLLIASGPRYATGAARLSATAALRAGAGLVTLVSPTEAMDILATHCTEIMLQAVDSVSELEQLFEDGRLKSIVIGPGFGVGEKCKQFVVTALKHCNTVVLDADALMSFADANKPDTKSLFAAIQASDATVVLTPHEGEFNKLALSCGLDSDAEQTKLTRTLALAAASGAYVVHKGADTVIASPTGESVLNVHGQPWLATAGSGDVLAGTIASILMQGRNNQVDSNGKSQNKTDDETLKLVAAAVWMHSEASRRLGPGLIAGDLPAVYRDILANLFGFSE